MPNPILSVAIPTFNRAAKLERLLTILQEEILRCHLQDRVIVVVSDNCSTDQTESVVASFDGSPMNIKYYKQPQNVGFDRNIRFLYEHAGASYTWFTADDDFPFPGALSKIVGAVERHDPDVMLFSFAQPPGSTVKQFDYPEAVRVITDPVSAINHVVRFPKLSILIIRVIRLDEQHWTVLGKFLDAGWFFISLAFSALQYSKRLKLAVISEALASCDEDYNIIGFTPDTLLRFETVMEHPYVLSNQAVLDFPWRDHWYYGAIQFAFAVKSGGLIAQNPHEYDQFIKNMKSRSTVLLKNRRSLLQFLALKFGIAGQWPKIRPLVRWMGG